LEIALIAFTPAKQSAIQHESKLDSSRYDNRTEVRAENRTTSVRILHGYCDIPFDGDGGRNESVWHSEEEVTLGHPLRLIFGTAIEEINVRLMKRCAATKSSTDGLLVPPRSSPNYVSMAIWNISPRKLGVGYQMV
jgi:hypothetical protein